MRASRRCAPIVGVRTSCCGERGGVAAGLQRCLPDEFLSRRSSLITLGQTSGAARRKIPDAWYQAYARRARASVVASKRRWSNRVRPAEGLRHFRGSNRRRPCAPEPHGREERKTSEKRLFRSRWPGMGRDHARRRRPGIFFIFISRSHPAHRPCSAAAGWRRNGDQPWHCRYNFGGTWTQQGGAGGPRLLAEKGKQNLICAKYRPSATVGPGKAVRKMDPAGPLKGPQGIVGFKG